jgi:Tol biopolymer transport system component
MTDVKSRLRDAAAGIEPSGRELERVQVRIRRRRLRRQIGTISVAALVGGLGLLAAIRAMTPTNETTPASTSPTGTLVFLRSEAREILFVHDTYLNAKPVVVLEDLETKETRVLTNATQQIQSPILSPDGTQLALSIGELRGETARWTTYVVDSSGKLRTVLTCRSAGCQTFPFAWSPDGAALAVYSNDDMTGTIWIVSADGQSQHRLVRTGDFFGGGAWSPDGRTIAFSSGRFGHPSILLVDVESGVARELRPPDVQLTRGLSWSPDGRTLALSADTDARSASIFALDLAGAVSRQVSQCDKCIDSNPVWSPDGGFIAFSRASSEGSDVYVIQADGSDLTQVTTSEDVECCVSWTANYVALEGANQKI